MYKTNHFISAFRCTFTCLGASDLEIVTHIQLKILDTGKTFSISTFYRVNNLGVENLENLKEHMTELALANKINKHIVIGDLNFPEIKWPDPVTTCQLHENFINFLNGNLGHSHLISEPTHKSGNILDLLFTNIPNQIIIIKKTSM